MAIVDPSVSAKPSQHRTQLIGNPLKIRTSPPADAAEFRTIPYEASSHSPRILMVTTLFGLPYRVLRCAQATNAEVYVLGTSGAWLLRFSRYCRRFFLSDCIINGDRDEALALEINHLVRELGITLVLPGDAPTTRALIACKDLIEAPCFPLPSLEQFDALNNKWSFTQLCKELGLRVPATRLLPNVAALGEQIATRKLDCPLVAKPLSRSGSVGVVVLNPSDFEARLRTINYRPIVVQELIAGRDIGASVYAEAGKIKAFVAHRYHRRVYSTFKHDQIYSDLTKIVGHYALEGVYNFDMILAQDHSVYYLECNPRFYWKIALSMVAGINFVEFGLQGERPKRLGLIPDGTSVRLPSAALACLVSGERPTKRDWAMATNMYSDPLPHFLEGLRLTEPGQLVPHWYR